MRLELCILYLNSIRRQVSREIFIEMKKSCFCEQDFFDYGIGCKRFYSFTLDRLGRPCWRKLASTLDADSESRYSFLRSLSISMVWMPSSAGVLNASTRVGMSAMSLPFTLVTITLAIRSYPRVASVGMVRLRMTRRLRSFS